MTDREAMKLALDALETIRGEKDIESAHIIAKNARYSLREALAQPEPFKPDWVSYRQGVADGAAQPEQEPVCDKDPNLCGFTLCQLAKVCKHTPKNKMPTKILGPNLEQILNASGFYKREWVGLTDDEIKKIMQRWRGEFDIRDIERLLKEKNT